ncbi:MAG: hypothetical protein ABSE18_04260 [Minisyncoccia bacterium]|jgi:hypothetical protein
MDIIGILNYLGITHDRALPFAILIVAMIYISYAFTAPIKRSVSKISNAILEIQTIFHQDGVELKCHLAEGTGSPLQPTHYGKQLIVESGLETILNDKKDFLRTVLAKKLPENYTEYDVQEKARELLIGLKRDQLMNPVKTYAYENGKDIDIILRVGGLWLRDDFIGQERKIVPEKG